MTLKRNTTFIVVLFFMAACSYKEVHNRKGELASYCDTISINKQIPASRPISQMLDSIEFVKLETSSKCLIKKIERVFFANNRFYIHDSRSNLFCFDRSGKFLFKIGGTGRGEGEFLSCDQVVLKESEGTVWVTDLLQRKALKYDLNGEFIGDKYYHFFSHTNFPLKDDKHCFYIGTRDNPDASFESHMLIQTDKDFDPESSYLPKAPYLNHISYSENRNGYFYRDSLSVKPIFQNIIYRVNENHIDEKYFLDFEDDQFITKAELKEIAKRGKERGIVFRLSETNKVYTIDFLLETDAYLFFIYNKGSSAITNFYSKRSKKLYNQAGFLDDAGTGITYQFPVGLAEEKFIFSLQAQQLFDENSDTVLQGKSIGKNQTLSDLRENSNINDNPVLVLAKFKVL